MARRGGRSRAARDSGPDRRRRCDEAPVTAIPMVKNLRVIGDPVKRNDD